MNYKFWFHSNWDGRKSSFVTIADARKGAQNEAEGSGLPVTIFCADGVKGFVKPKEFIITAIKLTGANATEA